MHFGSLLAAAASYLEARARGGRWLLRIEDIDPPREQPGAADRILQALDTYGFEWDGPAIYQSCHGDSQTEALEHLVAAGLAYRCGCSRSDLESAPRGPLGRIYPGTCRSGYDGDSFAIRAMTNNDPVGFRDRLQGDVRQRLASESGDFVILRRDGFIAYHLAVVVDDRLQGITDVVRGIDLLDSTPRQIWLQRQLDYPTPGYAHIPIAVDGDGEKLSKQTGAPPVRLDAAGSVLYRALAALHQQPPAELDGAPPPEIWSWARRHWRIVALEGLKRLPASLFSMADGENGLR